MRCLEKNLIVIPAILLFVFFFFLIKYGSSGLVEYWHARGEFPLLNTLANSIGEQGIDFYQGQIEDFVAGPLGSLMAGLALMFFSWRFLRQSSPQVFGAVIFIYFFLTRPEILFYPPYGESITGPFSDAVWLFRNNLDYAGLLQQETFTTGGPLIYPMDLYPLFLAALMKVTVTPQIFLVTIHLLVFAMTAAIVAMFRHILLKVFDEKIALAGALLLAAMPLFQSMAELINMEMPCAFFAVLSVVMMLERRIGFSAIAAVLALYTKAPGVIVCVVFWFGAAILFLTEKNISRWRIVGWSLFVFILVVSKSIARTLIIGEQTINNKISLFAGWGYMKSMPVLWIFAAAFIVFLVRVLKSWRDGKSIGKSWMSLCVENFPALLMYTMAVLWFGLYLNFSVMGYRYEVLLAPFFWFAVIDTLYSLTRRTVWFSRFLFVAAAFSFFCSYGLLYPREVSSVYSYNTLERSLEYRNDMKLNLKLAREMEERFSGWTIGAPFVTAQMLAFREIGYVTKSLDVVIYGYRATHEGMRDFTGFKNLNLGRTIWIGYEKSHLPPAIVFPVAPEDKIIKNIQVGNKEVMLFMGGLAIERVRVLIEMHSRKTIHGKNAS